MVYRVWNFRRLGFEGKGSFDSYGFKVGGLDFRDQVLGFRFRLSGGRV